MSCTCKSCCGTDTPEFVPFRKIARLNRDIVITEKIDGTNAQIVIGADGSFLTGSRNRWITPEDDNYGFSRWAHTNKTELLKLGPGTHFGEWWGAGIQRGYAIGEKRFSLFNVAKWGDLGGVRPECVGVVPVLYRGPFNTQKIEEVLEDLRQNGSKAAPGFNCPEGIVVFHTAAQILFKVTCVNDEKPKGQV